MPLAFVLARGLRVTPLLAVVLLAACQTTPSQQRAEPELGLLEAAALVIPKDCVVAGSFIVSFTVAAATGRTDAIRAPDAPSCVQDALTDWVASFRYEPPAKATPVTMEWMLVTAKRGS